MKYITSRVREENIMAEEKKTYKFVCTVCGYEVEVDTPELPEDYVCPVCGSVQGSRSNSRPGPF